MFEEETNPGQIGSLGSRAVVTGQQRFVCRCKCGNRLGLRQSLVGKNPYYWLRTRVLRLRWLRARVQPRKLCLLKQACRFEDVPEFAVVFWSVANRPQFFLGMPETSGDLLQRLDHLPVEGGEPKGQATSWVSQERDMHNISIVK